MDTNNAIVATVDGKKVVQVPTYTNYSREEIQSRIDEATALKANFQGEADKMQTVIDENQALLDLLNK